DRHRGAHPGLGRGHGAAARRRAARWLVPLHPHRAHAARAAADPIGVHRRLRALHRGWLPAHGPLAAVRRRRDQADGLRGGPAALRPGRALTIRPVNFAQLLFPDFSLILCGYLVCRFTALNRKVWEQVESLVYFFLFPVLLFHSIVKSPLDLGAASSLMGAGLSLGVCAIALSYSLPHWPWIGKHLDVRLHAASAQVGFRFNSFIALALAEKVAGPQGLLMI